MSTFDTFIIEKSVAGNFWHKFQGEKKKVHISNFMCVIDDVARTFLVQFFNSANIPAKAVSFNDLRVVDLSVSTTPIPFTDGESLVEVFKSIDYTPYIVNSGGSNTPIKVWSRGQRSFIIDTPEYISANFDENGVGILEMIGWEKDPEMADRFPVGLGSAPFDNIGAQDGSKNAVLIAHEADSAVLSDGKKGVNTLGTGATANGYVLVEAAANQKIVKTSKVGQDQDGNFSATETGENKNLPPYTVVLFVRRTEDLWINGFSGPSPTPFRPYKQIGEINDTGSYTLQLNEIYDDIMFTPNDGTMGIVLEDDGGWRLNGEYKVRTYGNPLKLTTALDLRYKGESITEITFDPGDTVWIKKIAEDPIWLLDITNKSTGGGGGDTTKYFARIVYDGGNPSTPTLIESTDNNWPYPLEWTYDAGNAQLVVKQSDGIGGYVDFSGDEFFEHQEIFQPLGDPLEVCQRSETLSSIIFSFLNSSLSPGTGMFEGLNFGFKIKIELPNY